MKKDLFTTMKGNSQGNPSFTMADFKESVFDLAHRTLQEGGLSPADREKVARLRAYIEINL